MARRAKKKQEVSLFPFLDILACVIGNLILIITAVVLEQVDTKPVADAAEYEAQLVKVKEQEQQVEQLEKQLEQMRTETASTSVELEKVEEEVEAVEEKLREARSQVAKIPKTPPQIDPALLQEKKLREEELRKLEEETTKIKADIAERQKKPEQSISLLPGKIAGLAGGAPSKAVFVEINKEGLIIYPDQPLWQEKQPLAIKTAAIATDAALGKLLAAVLGDEAAIVTFLMRPDCLDVYNSAKARFDAFQKSNEAKLKSPINPQDPDSPLQVRKLYGAVPLPGDGVLDFSGVRE
jgi:myosin heavy subunit